MTILDDRGRLFGLVNVFDLLVVVSLLALVPIFYLGHRVFNPPRPVIESVTPKAVWFASGVPVITIRGGNFDKESEVRISGELVGSPIYLSPTQLEVRLPDAYRARLGWHAVQVTNSWRVGTILENAFQIISAPEFPPEILRITLREASAPLVIAIFGRGFAADSRITVSGKPAENVRYISSSELWASLPESIWGELRSHHVEVVNSSGRSAGFTVQMGQVELVVSAVADGFPAEAFGAVSVGDRQYLWSPDLQQRIPVGAVKAVNDLRSRNGRLMVTLRLVAISIQDVDGSTRYFYRAGTPELRIGLPFVFSTERYELPLRIVNISKVMGSGSKK